MEDWKPHQYQQEAVRFMVQQGAAGLLLDPGLGKTSITLAAFKVLRDTGLVRRALIIAPLRPALSVWPREVSKWSDFAGLRLNVLHGEDKRELLNSEADIDVVNYDGLKWLFAEASRLKAWPWQMLVCDESTRIKHTNTQRFKVLRPHLSKFKRRYILTGTPAPNGLMDLFGQVYALDQGSALGRFITHYRATYFTPAGFGGYTWSLKPGAEKLIQEKLRPLCLRMSAEQYLTLPPLINNTVLVELPPAARRVYGEMETLLMAAVEDNLVTAANAASVVGKCRQIANGGVYHAAVDGQVTSWSHVHEAKLDAVKDLVEELGGKPCLVAYEFRHDLERLQKAFPDAPYLGGGISAKRQREVEDLWNAGFIPVLLAQPQSVAHGLNLQGVGAAVILHSLTWDLENYDQFIRRVK